ncbi:MAG: hypothetical protein Q9160_008258 [Pyrenula sp. 1 TL-2023]
MPIKLPRKFPRRKSSGPILDEVEGNATESSFRVIERPKSGAKSFDGGNTWKRLSAGRPNSTTKLEMEGNFLSGNGANRGSGGTDISGSTGKNNSSAASSMRLSAASTVPSSTDLPGDISSSTHWPLQNIPNPPAARPRPRPGLRAGVRTMSFGLSAAPPSETYISRPKSAYEDPSLLANASRPRAMTTSTTSTATPPKLLDSDFALNGADLDGFGNMFEGIGKTDKPIAVTVSPEERSQQRSGVPNPINTDRAKEIEPSPYSWTSQNSNDGLMKSSTPSPAQSTFNVLPRKPIPNPKGPIRTGPPAEPEESSIGVRFRKSIAKLPTRKSTPNLREGTKSTSPNPQEQAPPFSKHSKASLFQGSTDHPDDEALDFQFRQPPRDISRLLEKPSIVTRFEDGSDEDQAFLAQADLAAQYEQTESPIPIVRPSNKIMTPEQFERYRHERESTQRLNAALKVTESDDEEEAEEDVEEDELERNRQTAKQRQKQEAHLAVYRQQMMKVTGEQPMDGGRNFSRPSLPSGSSSTPNLASKISTLGIDPSSSPGGKSSEEEDDEDVPLGILAAHGFPSKNRPPTRLTNAGSNPDLRGSAASVAGGDGSRANLPVFARHLPQDPYYGASLVNHTNRESLAMSGGMSVRGATPPSTMPPGVAPPGLHPGGLVGVIAGEERAKAMRRGSPNGQAAYDPVTGGLPGMPGPNPQMVRSQTAGAVPGMGQPYGDQAQIQMSQQMQQMMQMQMQWMQQMMQMQGFQPGQPQMPMAGADQPAMSQDPSQRPMSAHPSGLRNSGRTMSSLEPSMARWDRGSHLGPAGQNYAASIAPTERSNIGMASRYRPVSTMNSPSMARASTFTSSSFQPWNNRDSLLKESPVSTIRPVAVSKTGGSDDEDDQAWAEMKRKKDKKRSTWKNKKGHNQSALQDLYPAGI